MKWHYKLSAFVSAAAVACMRRGRSSRIGTTKFGPFCPGSRLGNTLARSISQGRERDVMAANAGLTTDSLSVISAANASFL